MALIIADRVRDTTTSTGTGTITLADVAPTGFRKFGDVCSTGDTVPYTIEMGGEWEVGIGTYSTSGPTLSRDTIKASSNSGSAVNFSAGTKDVYLSAHASTANFTGLGDTPNSFAGAGGSLVRVKGDASGLEFGDAAFTELSDAPNSFAGAGGALVRVNDAASALEFLPCSTTDPQIGDVFRWNGSLFVPSYAREVLTANRTYYVRTDGSDSNDGLTDSSGGAFLTIQKAIDVACALDMSIYAVTIKVGAGTFAQNLTITGNGNARVSIIGAGRANTTIGTGSGDPIYVTYGVQVTLQGFTFANASVALWARFGAVVLLNGDLQFSGASARLIGADNGSYIQNTSGSTYLSANAGVFLYAESFGSITFASAGTIHTTQAIAISSNVVHCRQGRIALGATITWDESAGSITGKRYLVDQNGVIAANGGTIPGTVAGTVATGGQYL